MFTGLFKRRNRQAGRKAVSRAAGVACEVLEDRTLMSVVIHPVFGSEPQTQDNGSRINDPAVYLIFWGSYWNGVNSAQSQAIENGARAVFNSPFLGTTNQYGVSSNAQLAGYVYDGSNAPNGFTTGDIDNVIQNQIDNGALPEYDEQPHYGMYVVVTPPGISSNLANAGGYNTEGSDYDFPFDIDNHIPEIWVSTSASSVDRFSIILSHEMAEAMTDSGGNGIEFSAPAAWTGGGHGNQIGDFEPNAYSFREPNGALVQPLWSRANNAIAVDNGTSQQFDLYPIWSGGSFTGTYNLVVNGDQHGNHDDYISLGETAGGGVSVTLNGDTTTFDPGRIAHVQINSGDGADNIWIQQTVVATNVVSAGSATVHVGGGANMQGIVAPLNIENPSYFSTIIMDDGADSGSRFGTLFTRGSNPADSQGNSDAWGEVTGLSPAPVSFEYGDTSSITIHTSGGGGTFNVQNTVVPTTIAGNGHTTINVGSSNTVASIGATLNLENPSSYNTININDSADPNNRTLSLRTLGTNTADTDGNIDPWGQITGLSPGLINYEYSDTTSITVLTGYGANTINVLATGVPTYLTGNSDDPRSGGGDTINVGNNSTVSDINGALHIEDPPSYDVINVNDGVDRTARTVTFHTTAGPDADNFGTISGLAAADISYEYADVTALNVTLGVGNDTVNVQATGTTTNISGGAVPLIILPPTLGASTPAIILPPFLVGGDNTINVGNGSTQSIAGTLTIENPYGQNVINVDDGTDTTGRTVNLDTTTSVSGDAVPYGAVTGISPATIQYEYSDTSAVNFTMGVGGNTVNVHTTGVPTNFDGGSVPIILTPLVSSRTLSPNIIIPFPRRGGPDTYNVGNAGSMQGINGKLNIENNWGYNTIALDDSADTTARAVTLDSFTPTGDTPWQSVHGLAPADVKYESADVDPAHPVVILGGSGGNTFNVNAVSPFAASTGLLDLRTGTGNDTVNLLGQAVTNLNVNGQAGNDTLNLIGANAADAFTLALGQIGHGAGTATYSNVPNLTLDPGTFNVTADLGAINLNAVSGDTAVTFGATQNLASLAVNAAAATIAPGGGKTLNAGALSISGGGKLDLRDNALQVHYGAGPDPMAAIRSWIIGGYAGGSFTGAGLNTASADAHHGLGYADSADGVVAGLASHTVVVKYALYGDANLDGTVNFADLLIVAQNYSKHPGSSNWDQGDCNYDGNVDFSDLLKLAQGYGL